MKITTKRIYDDPAGKAGCRVLVDRFWPRGLKKDQLHLETWLKEIGPSAELCKWFGHDPARWPEFKRRYFAELRKNQATVDQLLTSAGDRPLVLLYGAKDTEHNQAIALKEYLEASTGPGQPAKPVPHRAGAAGTGSPRQAGR